MIVHESSLSASVHAILAAELGKEEKAVEMYERTARLDLDNYNNDHRRRPAHHLDDRLLAGDCAGLCPNENLGGTWSFAPSCRRHGRLMRFTLTIAAAC